MRDNLLSCGICIQMFVSIAVCGEGGMDTDLIVVTLSVEAKPSNQCSNFVVLLFEVNPVLNVTQIGVKIVT